MVRIQGGQKIRERVTNTCSAAAEHAATVNNPVPCGAPSARSAHKESALNMPSTPNPALKRSRVKRRRSSFPLVRAARLALR